ncbi:MAG: DoxX family protein [Bacteroidia bacterium]|nr:MAG: DoxX family protein [Bacteroidia bacterium]
MCIIIWLSRILFGAVFVFSGFVKAIDPLGSAYKFQDYFVAFGVEWLFFTALPMAIILSTLELVIGIAVLVGIKMKYSAWGGLLFMAFFTPLTLFIAITDPVPDCGCFGDAIIISNWDTFYKNLFILAAAIIVFIYRNKIKPLWSKKGDWFLLAGLTGLTIGLSAYCLMYLPVIDFRPWKVGNNISELVIPSPEVADLYLIFEHNETGETAEYPAGDYPWDDPEWVANWSFKDQRREVIIPFEEAEIENFYIEDEFGDDLTEFFITHDDYWFLVVAHDLNRTHTRAFNRKITPLAKSAEQEGYKFIVLTGSSLDAMEAFRHEHQTPYPFYLSDEIELKTIVRSNPGLLLLKDGVVLAKWPHRRIPDFETIQGRYMD